LSGGRVVGAIGTTIGAIRDRSGTFFMEHVSNPPFGLLRILRNRHLESGTARGIDDQRYRQRLC